MIINPTVIVDCKPYDIFSRNLDQRVIYISGEICDDMAASVVAQLIHLASVSNDDIQLYINSPGGSVSAGLAIYDTMQKIEPDVATICMGHAASMAAIILSGGARGKRYAMKHSEVMIHQPSTGMEGKSSDLQIAAKHVDRIKTVTTGILAENCQKDIKKVAKDIEHDYWMNADEAVSYGIVDKIM